MMPHVSNDSVSYMVFDCYPIAGGPAFLDYAGAAAGCWMRADAAEGQVGIRHECCARLKQHGWMAMRAILMETVNASTYEYKEEGRLLFEQALVDGFVTQLHLRRREWMWRRQPQERLTANELTGAASSVAKHGCFGLLGSEETGWVICVAPSGDEFLPLWEMAADAEAWRRRLGGRHHGLTVERFTETAVLDDVNNDDRWIALGVGRDTLVTCHPLWLRDSCGKAGLPETSSPDGAS